MDTLRSLTMSGVDVDANQLKILEHSAALTSLRLISCRLTEDAVGEIAAKSHLRTLSLRRCSLRAVDLTKLGRLPNLEDVDLAGTGVQLADMDSSKWASSVRILHLSRPAFGQSSRVAIKGWNALEELTIRSRDREANDQVLEIELADCPQLRRVQISRRQKHSLIASNLPELQGFDETFDMHSGFESFGFESFAPRLHKLSVSDLPKLRTLNFLIDDLELIELSKVPHLSSVSLMRMDLDRSVSSEVIQSSIDAISGQSSINQLTIVGVSLNESQFQKLCHLPFLQQFDCLDAKLEEVDLGSIQFPDSIQVVNFGQATISQQAFDYLLELPNLSSVEADFSAIVDLKIRSHPRITSLGHRAFHKLRTVDLEDLPRFQTGVMIDQVVERIRLVKVPRLKRIVVGSPWPKDYQLDRLTSVVAFAAGGEKVTDDIFGYLLTCRKLDELSLAYPSLSQTVLNRMGELNFLTKLELPGCLIDDQTVGHWKKLKNLRHVCLDDTKIGAATISWLSSLPSLRSVSLNYLEIDREAANQLAGLKQVSHLSLVQTPLDPESMIALLTVPTIEHLDLSGNKLDQSVVEAIAASTSLKTCVLRDCGLSSAQANAFLKASPNLRVDADEIEKIRPVIQTVERLVKSAYGPETRPRRRHDRYRHDGQRRERHEHNFESRQNLHHRSRTSNREQPPFSIATFRKQSKG